MNSLAVKNEVRVDLKFNKSKEYMWSLDIYLWYDQLMVVH